MNNPLQRLIEINVEQGLPNSLNQEVFLTNKLLNSTGY